MPTVKARLLKSRAKRTIAFLEVTGMFHLFVGVAVTAVFVLMSAVKKNAHNQL